MKWILGVMLGLIFILAVSGCTSQTGQITGRQTTYNNTEQEESSKQNVLFTSLEDLFSHPNPRGMMVNIAGIGIQVHGYDVEEMFYFTDDDRVMHSPTYATIGSGAKHVIYVYGASNVNFRQHLVNITGTVVDCKEGDGIWCIQAKNVIVGDFVNM